MTWNQPIPQYNPADAFRLAGATNAYMTGAARAPYIANMPGYLANVTQSGINTGAKLRGQVPQDVIDLLQQRGAERADALGLDWPLLGVAVAGKEILTGLALAVRAGEVHAIQSQADLWQLDVVCTQHAIDICTRTARRYRTTRPGRRGCG